MTTRVRFHLSILLLSLAYFAGSAAEAQQPEIPDVLKPWQDWVTWDDTLRNCPTAYNDARDRISFWPSQLSLAADSQQGSWKFIVAVFAETWVPLPGSNNTWPLNVIGNGNPIAVVEREGRPAAQLAVGRHELSGEFFWDQMPQRIAIPKEIGLLSLSISGQSVLLPDWDPNGHVWLKRQRAEQAEQNRLEAQVYRVVEDGIPMWLRTEVELTVSGKNREEELGWVLPEGWKLVTVDSPLPVAMDQQGRMKAQVRPGKWTVQIHAFRPTDTEQIQFAEIAQPITNLELVGFKAKPDFRLAELTGLAAVDVTQTTFPSKWRDIPVYRWDTAQGFQLVEKIRGMDSQRPKGININRQLWLDEDGQSLTYRDAVQGQLQQTWRLDAAEGQQLGAVRVDGKGQLITSNPTTGAHGVEIRTRKLNLEAVGRIPGTRTIRATGWRTDADSLDLTLHLPPGWRVYALFGADKVRGDWLTAWSLLDLFLLLIFGLAVSRIWGIGPGVIAFLAFGLAYHELGSPRLTWLFLLLPLALLRVVPDGAAQTWIKAWKYLAMALLLINLAPFLANQIQTALYPQLESPGINYSSRGMFGFVNFAYRTGTRVADLAYETSELAKQAAGRADGRSRFETSNLLYDPKALIQTGPAQPEWSWNQVQCSWDSPVPASHEIRPILITLQQHRLLTVVRVALLTLLAAILFGFRRWAIPRPKQSITAGIMLCMLCSAPDLLEAQEIPDESILKMLRERLLQPSDAFPRAGEIPSVELKLDENRVTMNAEVHTALEVAVPLPGRVPTWSPVSVAVDGRPAELVCRKDEYLWIVLPKGVHQVEVKSILPAVPEWEWTFVLKPRTVSIEAPGWNVSGVRPNGVPEDQVFFARPQPATQDAAYDRKDFNAVLAVDRQLETGLIWQIRNEVTRLSPIGKAVSIKVPLLPGERVLTQNVVVDEQTIEVRLGANQQKFSWTSDLPVGADIQLAAPETDQWVERWQLITSPVWNVSTTGLPPVFESQQQFLIPVWHAWPGESVSLSFNKPEPVVGETVTVQRVQHDCSLRNRLRETILKLDVESSLGVDFPIELESAADISSLMLDGQAIPQRRDGETLIVPVHPGKQKVEITWSTNETMQPVASIGSIKLPAEGANITSVIHVPPTRWVLWADGPTRGPAVRFWTILVFAILAALLLGSSSISPLGRLEWILLAIGLTQVHIVAALIVVAWLFLLARRGKRDLEQARRWIFNLEQIGIVFMTFISLAILIVVVGAGLLGNPDMFIIGNGSSQTYLKWFQPRVADTLPEPMIISVSVWYYQLLMLFWALWLAAALIRWLSWGWTQFSQGGCWKRKPKLETA